jgi:hypothetical protein
VAMPRNSFVLSALEGGRTLANFLWIAMAAWWQGDGRIRGAAFSASADIYGARREIPQPLQAFPELRRFSVHDPWFANPEVRAQCMWSHVGFGGQRYQYFLVSNGQVRTLGILMREQELAYMRLHANYTFAAIDGTLWAGEIRHRPVVRVYTNGGIDPVRHHTWSVFVIKRHRRYELQITTGGLIPWTHDFRTLDEALLYAEICVSEFQHRDAEPVREPEPVEWLM